MSVLAEMSDWCAGLRFQCPLRVENDGVMHEIAAFDVLAHNILCHVDVFGFMQQSASAKLAGA